MKNIEKKNLKKKLYKTYQMESIYQKNNPNLLFKNQDLNLNYNQNQRKIYKRKKIMNYKVSIFIRLRTIIIIFLKKIILRIN